ncbi:MAG: hypothetical protein GF334_11620, partial [Candidatus Altiarchaeales archaeon]|nr:hypothetical protein [Candidatus Altiarchaeales archaeon]
MSRKHKAAKAKKEKVDYKELQKGLGNLAKGLQGLNEGMTKVLSEIPAPALSYMDEKVLARKYEDMNEAADLAKEIGGMKIRKRALWLPWKRKKPAQPPVVYVPMPGYTGLSTGVKPKPKGPLDLRKVWKWLQDSPPSTEKDVILSKIQDQKRYLKSIGKTKFTIQDVITHDIFNEIFE